MASAKKWKTAEGATITAPPTKNHLLVAGEGLVPTGAHSTKAIAAAEKNGSEVRFLNEGGHWAAFHMQDESTAQRFYNHIKGKLE